MKFAVLFLVALSLSSCALSDGLVREGNRVDSGAKVVP